MFAAQQPASVVKLLCLTVCLPIVVTMTGTSAEAEPAATKSSAVISLDGPAWLLATDPKNVGRQEKWWEGPTAGAKATKVPWVIQDIFPESWYRRDFDVPVNPHVGGHYLL
jgi:hypothetical protein